jgi:hypothetical protein
MYTLETLTPQAVQGICCKSSLHSLGNAAGCLNNIPVLSFFVMNRNVFFEIRFHWVAQGGFKLMILPQPPSAGVVVCATTSDTTF